MENLHESEIRLAEVIWRTIKLRASLLILSIVVLLASWSSLLNGNQEAQKIDTKFCEYLIDQHNVIQRRLTEEVNKSLKTKPKIPKAVPVVFSSVDFCQTTPSRTWIEVTRNIDETTPDIFATSPPSPPELSFLAEFAASKKKAFEDYDKQRYAAYRIQIQLSSEYSGSTITLNALSVAKVVPFCILGVLAMVVALGFQQASYKRQLRSLLLSASDKIALVMAETQFLAAPLRRRGSRLIKYLEVYPLGFAIASLSVAVVLSLIGLTSTFVLNLIHLTDSVILSYPFALYGSITLLACALLITRKSYIANTQPDSEESDERRASPLSSSAKWLTIFGVIAATVSLGFRWATNTVDPESFFKGFEFLLNQQPTGQLFNFMTYDLSPQVFRDARIQVTVATIFLFVCVLDALFRSNQANPVIAFLRETRTFLAIGVLALAVYFLMYMGTLQYEAVYWVPWLDQFAYQGSANAKGYPMIFYNPAYGFWIFLSCCLLLIWLSFARETGVPGTLYLRLINKLGWRKNELS